MRLSQGIPSKSSKFADEGTAAHALQEYCLRGDFDPFLLIGQDFPYEDHGEDRSIVVPEEMGLAIQGVWHQINAEMSADPDAVLLVEERFHLHQLHKDLFGTGDVAIWFPAARKLQVRDLKYGAGVAVEIEDEDGEANVQLEGYALGALLKYPEWKPVEVEIVIDQPRAFHADGATRRKTLPVSYFVDMAADLVDEVKRTEEATAAFSRICTTVSLVQWEDEYLKQGDHCRWCPAAPVCPKLKNKAQELAKQVFAAPAPGASNLSDAGKPGYDAKALAETLDWLPILEAWLANVREFAYSEAEKGHPIPNYKLVAKRATRKWRDEAAAIAWLKQQGLEPYGEPPVVTPAAAEKKLDKEQRAFMTPLVVAESSGHVLVHESDKREAVRVDAKAAFG
ncbi:MAG TPA: DUF2800 domain-containing protein, partial [Rhizobacter sp.]|nr:DUF2800 domain-containing protein [Rhizobacter sp.]